MFFNWFLLARWRSRCALFSRWVWRDSSAFDVRRLGRRTCL